MQSNTTIAFGSYTNVTDFIGYRSRYAQQVDFIFKFCLGALISNERHSALF